MTVGCTIHCKSWLVVMALMVGIKALLEPGISFRYFCCKEVGRGVPGNPSGGPAGELLLPRDELSKLPG